MSKREISVCDQCGREEESDRRDTPPGWFSVYGNLRDGRGLRSWHLCSRRCLTDWVLKDIAEAVVVERSLAVR